MGEETEEVIDYLTNTLFSPEFAKKTARFYATFVKELEREGFERKEAISIATAHRRQQSK